MVYVILLKRENPIQLGWTLTTGSHGVYATEPPNGSILCVCKLTYCEAHAVLYGPDTKLMYTIGGCPRKNRIDAILYNTHPEDLPQLRRLGVHLHYLNDLVPRRTDKDPVYIWDKLCNIPKLEALSLTIGTGSSQALILAIACSLTSMTSTLQPTLVLAIEVFPVGNATNSIREPQAGIKYEFNNSFLQTCFRTFRCPKTEVLEIKGGLDEQQLDSIVDVAGEKGDWHLQDVGTKEEDVYKCLQWSELQPQGELTEVYDLQNNQNSSEVPFCPRNHVLRSMPGVLNSSKHWSRGVGN